LIATPNGVWRCLRRHGLNTRAKRLSLPATGRLDAAGHGVERADWETIARAVLGQTAAPS
jgi:hypothetical protein